MNREVMKKGVDLAEGTAPPRGAARVVVPRLREDRLGVLGRLAADDDAVVGARVRDRALDLDERAAGALSDNRDFGTGAGSGSGSITQVPTVSK